jgi:hypothetical protein
MLGHPCIRLSPLLLRPRGLGPCGSSSGCCALFFCVSVRMAILIQDAVVLIGAQQIIRRRRRRRVGSGLRTMVADGRRRGLPVIFRVCPGEMLLERR